MSTNSRYRERKYNSNDNDRLSRILSQPVQSWEKKWAPSSRSKSHPIFKWVKSDRTIVFEDEDDDEDDEEDDEEEEDKDQVMTEMVKDPSHATSQIGSQHQNESTVQAPNANTTTETLENKPTGQDSSISDTNNHNTGLFTTTQNHDHTINDHDEEPTHTPKLSDVPDVDPDQMMEDKEINTEDLNDASRHPAFAPHIHPQLTDDDEHMAAYNQNIITGTEHLTATAMDHDLNQSISNQSSTITQDPLTAIQPEANHIEPIAADLNTPIPTTIGDGTPEQIISTAAAQVDTTTATGHEVMDTVAPSIGTINHDGHAANPSSQPVTENAMYSTDATLVLDSHQNDINSGLADARTETDQPPAQ